MPAAHILDCLAKCNVASQIRNQVAEPNANRIDERFSDVFGNLGNFVIFFVGALCLHWLVRFVVDLGGFLAML